MFAYPRQAEVDRVLPKTKIYAHAKAGKVLQRRFVEQVERVVWRYKLSPETINLTARKSVREVQVFAIHLKTDEVHLDVLRAIDRTIRHPIAFQLRHGERVRCAMAPKRPSEADVTKWVVGEYFHTEWADWSATAWPNPPTVLDLAALYEALLRAHLSLPARPGESLAEQVERLGELQTKRREAERLAKKVAQERQFNRKVELNRELRAVQASVERLGSV